MAAARWTDLGGLRRGGSAPAVGEGEHRVTLTRARPSVSLTNSGMATGNLRINLAWTMRPADPPRQRRSLVPRPSRLFEPVRMTPPAPALVNVDLDLGCLWELTDGTKGVVQPLGGLLGSLRERPYVSLSGDDRYGSPSGETMFVNLDHLAALRRLLIFVYIYDGTPAFDRTHGVVTLFPYVGPRIEVELDEREPQARSCAVLLLENHEGNLTARREMRYVYGFQAELDRLYGWGLQWRRGNKDADAG